MVVLTSQMLNVKEKAYTACADVPKHHHIQLSVEDVGACLSRIKPHKGPGPDGLGGRILKVCSGQLKEVLTTISTPAQFQIQYMENVDR